MLTKYTYVEEDKKDIRLREEEGNGNNDEGEETVQRMERLFFKDYISDDEERTDAEWLDEDYNSADESNISHEIYLEREARREADSDYDSLEDDEKYRRIR